jgi:stress response protein YsnF
VRKSRIGGKPQSRRCRRYRENTQHRCWPVRYCLHKFMGKRLPDRLEQKLFLVKGVGGITKSNVGWNLSTSATCVGTMPSDSKLPPEQTITVPITEEVISVNTRAIETGRGVRIHKTVHTQPVIIDETLAHEEVDVRRVTVDRTLNQSEPLPSTRYEGEIMIIPVFEEVLLVERRMRLKEELHVTRIRREQPYSETIMVKTEQVSIERFDDGTS